MKASKKYLIIKNNFEDNRDYEKAIPMAKYMRNKFQFYGIMADKRKSIYKSFLTEEKKRNIIDWDFLDLCMLDEYREFQYLMCDYLINSQNELGYDDIYNIKRYITNKSWWDTVDILHKVIGNIGLRDERVNNLMIDWSVDENLWLKRVAINHQNGRKEKTNEELLNEILINNLDDDDFFIKKAVGWSLREYSKTNSIWVRNFISKNEEKMSKLSIREGSKYI